MTLDNLTEDGREELALMILLWKDFKTQGRMDFEITKQAIDIATMLGVMKQFNDLMPKLPPMEIKPRA